MHRDESLRGFLVPMDTDFDLLHTARNLSAPASPGSRFQRLWEHLTKAHGRSGFTRSLTASPARLCHARRARTPGGGPQRGAVLLRRAGDRVSWAAPGG